MFFKKTEMPDAVAIQNRAIKEFDIVFAAIGIIPTLGFVYIILGKVLKYDALTKDVSAIMLIIVALTVLGLIAGHNTLRYLLNELLRYHAEVERIQGELIKQERVNAVTETAITLSHEINNPLAVISGKIQLANSQNQPIDKESLDLLKTNCDRIKDVTVKLANLMKPISTNYVGKATMIDLNNSE